MIEYWAKLVPIASLLRKWITFRSNPFERCVLRKLLIHTVGPILVVLGIAGEMIFETQTFVVQDAQTTADELQIAQLQRDNLTLSKQAGDAATSAHNAAADAKLAKESLDTVNKEAARISQQLLSQQRRGDILMDLKLRAKFVSPLKRFHGQYFDVSSCRMTESEIAYFSMSIWGTLSGVPRWNIGNLEETGSCQAGLIVFIGPDAPAS